MDPHYKLQIMNIELHGYSMELHNIRCNSIDTQTNSMEFHGTPRTIHGIPWHYSMDHRGTTWHSMELHRYSMDFHGNPLILHGTSWHSMEFHENSINTLSHGQFLVFVTKIQTKKLSLLLSFYLHVVLQHLKTFIQKKNSVRKGSSFCDTGRLNFQAFAWRGS